MVIRVWSAEMANRIYGLYFEQWCAGVGSSFLYLYNKSSAHAQPDDLEDTSCAVSLLAPLEKLFELRQPTLLSFRRHTHSFGVHLGAPPCAYTDLRD